MLRIVVPDLAAFSDLMMKSLLCLPGVARIKTSIALQTVKQTHVLPLGHLRVCENIPRSLPPGQALGL
jgi:Lrp/AsnC family leucine-responsive transcriptional regulator